MSVPTDTVYCRPTTETAACPASAHVDLQVLLDRFRDLDAWTTTRVESAVHPRGSARLLVAVSYASSARPLVPTTRPASLTSAFAKTDIVPSWLDPPIALPVQIGASAGQMTRSSLNHRGIARRSLEATMTRMNLNSRKRRA